MSSFRRVRIVTVTKNACEKSLSTRTTDAQILKTSLAILTRLGCILLYYFSTISKGLRPLFLPISSSDQFLLSMVLPLNELLTYTEMWKLFLCLLLQASKFAHELCNVAYSWDVLICFSLWTSKNFVRVGSSHFCPDGIELKASTFSIGSKINYTQYIQSSYIFSIVLKVYLPSSKFFYCYYAIWNIRRPSHLWVGILNATIIDGKGAVVSLLNIFNTYLKFSK